MSEKPGEITNRCTMITHHNVSWNERGLRTSTAPSSSLHCDDPSREKGYPSILFLPKLQHICVSDTFLIESVITGQILPYHGANSISIWGCGCIFARKTPPLWIFRPHSTESFSQGCNDRTPGVVGPQGPHQKGYPFKRAHQRLPKMGRGRFRRNTDWESYDWIRSARICW